MYPNKPPFDERQAFFWLAAVFLVCMLLFSLCVQVANAQEPVVITVDDLSRGIDLSTKRYVNDPERIIWSENMYSRQAGARQFRPGARALLQKELAGGIESFTFFKPKYDSAALVVAANGKWYWTYIGKRVGGEDTTLPSLSALREIRPYIAGPVTHSSGSGEMQTTFGDKWTRHLQIGDSIEVGSFKFTVEYVMSDIFAKIDPVSGDTSFSDSSDKVIISRSYNGDRPYLHASGDYVFTGSAKDPPQVIYSYLDTLYIRPLVMVDSFYVDAIYNHYTDSTDSGTTLRHSWDTVSTGEEVIQEVQLVSRRATWLPNEWIQSAEDAPQSYFLRKGWYQTDLGNQAMFYPIRGNSDTGVYISAWYLSDTLLGPNNWRDSILLGRGLMSEDTMTVTDMANSRWAYIYCSAGEYEVTLEDEDTDSIVALGRGAVWVVPDTAGMAIDADTFWSGLHYIHLTRDDISFPSYSTKSNAVRTYTIYRSSVRGELRLTQDELPAGDTIIATDRTRTGFTYTISTRRGGYRTIDADYIGQAFYPIRYAKYSNDSLFFVTSAADADMLADTSTGKTPHWEIIKVGLPSWSGMAEWRNSPELVAWGDTSSPSIVSRSQNGNLFDWSALSDLAVGDDVNKPVTYTLPYDDHLVFFKENSMIGYDGFRFTELSASNGLVASRGIVSENKNVWWYKDGLWGMARRDFSGYSIQPVPGLEPIFEMWDSTAYGSDVLPVTLNDDAQDLSVLAYNEQDEHLYLFVAMKGSSEPNACFTFDLKRKQWDGHFTFPATWTISDAMYGEVADTSQLLLGGFVNDGTDTAALWGMGYGKRENGDYQIDATLTSGRFWLAGKDGRPVESIVGRAWLQSRAGAGASGDPYDSAKVVLIGDGTETMQLDSTAGDYEQTWRLGGNTLSQKWQWQLKVFGADNISDTDVWTRFFQANYLQFELTPIRRAD